MNLSSSYGDAAARMAAVVGSYWKHDVKIVDDGSALLAPRSVRSFVLAGNATFTVVSKKTGTRFTFRVRVPKDKGSDLRFVSVLTGSCNESDYQYLGVVAHGRTYVHGLKSRISLEAPSAKAACWFFFRALRGLDLADCDVWHAGTCGRCGRKLTVPESIATGLGPECAGKVRGS